MSRSCGLMVRASPRDEGADGHLADAGGAGDAGRAVAHHVQGPQPEPGAAGVQAGAGQGRAGDGAQGGGGVGSAGAAAGDQVVDRGGGQAGGGGDAAVGAAVSRRRRTWSRAAPGPVSGGRGSAGCWPAGAGVLMLMSVRCLGLVIGRVGTGLAGSAGGVQGPGDLGVVEAGVAGGGGQGAQVGGRVGLQGAVGGPEQARVAVAFGLGGDPAGQAVQGLVGGRAGLGALLVAAGVAGAG